MSKPKSKFPSVFLACPFDKNKSKLLEVLEWLPWNIKTADKRITNDHLLSKVSQEIKECDFAIFDLTGWNANVCLELGIACGLDVDYYILNNNSVKIDVPSDIKGIERIDYNWNKKKKALDLYEQIARGIFRNQFITSKIWKELQGTSRADDKFYLVLYMLSQMKSVKKTISKQNLKSFSQGLHFKKWEDIEATINTLVKLKIVKRMQKSGNLVLIKNIYK